MRAIVTFCIDTSSFLEAWARSYPRDIFPGFWGDFRSLIESQVIVTPEQVRDELARKSDGASQWAESFEGFVVPFDEEQENHVVTVMTGFPELAKEGSNRNRADPFVIALAKSQSLCVITEEAEGNARKPRIPYVCKQLDIECIDILALMRLQRWKY